MQVLTVEFLLMHGVVVGGKCRRYRQRMMRKEEKKKKVPMMSP